MQQLETCTFRSSFHFTGTSTREPERPNPFTLTQHSQNRTIFNIISTIPLLFRIFNQIISNLSASLFQRGVHAHRPAGDMVNERKNRTNDVDQKPRVVAVAVVEVSKDFVHGRVDSVDRLEIVSESGNTD